MNDDKKAKIILTADKIIDIDKLPVGSISELQFEKSPVQQFAFDSDQYFMTEEEKRENQAIIITTSLRIRGKVKDLVPFYNAKFFKVVPLDESGNIVE